MDVAWPSSIHSRKGEQKLVPLQLPPADDMKGWLGLGQEEVMRWSWDLMGL